MSRPLRIEFPGALYHLTARGDRQEPIFDDDGDRRALLDVLASALDRFDACCFAYCLMGNHYHFVLQTRRANLSRCMRHVNGVYSQRYNRRHAKVGHLFQGRFNAVLVDSDAYLLEVCRYVDLNPVRAGMVTFPQDWRWSSYRAHAGLVAPPAWLATEALQRCVAPHAARRIRGRAYAAFVARGHHVRLWEDVLVGQIFLGDAAFAERMRARTIGTSQVVAPSREVPRQQRRAPMLPMQEYLHGADGRDAGIAAAFLEGGHSQAAIAAAVGLSASRVSRVIAAAQRRLRARSKT